VLADGVLAGGGRVRVHHCRPWPRAGPRPRRPGLVAVVCMAPAAFPPMARARC
jgi:hypothetical protein